MKDKDFIKTRRIPARYVNQGKVNPKKEKAARSALKWEPIAVYKADAFAKIRRTKLIFYNKHINYAYCSNCDTEFESKPEYRHEKKATCPNCRKELTLKNIRLFNDGKEFYGRSMCEYFQKGRTKGSFCCAYSEFEETVILTGGKAYRTRGIRPLSVLVILPDDTRVRFEKRSEYNHRSKCWESSFVVSNRLSFWCSFLGYSPYGLDTDTSMKVKKSVIKGSHFAYYEEAYPNIDADVLCLMTDEIERLFKAGYSNLAKGFLKKINQSSWRKRATVDVPVGKTPKQMLGLTGEYARYFEEQTTKSYSELDDLLMLQKGQLDLSLMNGRLYLLRNRIQRLVRLGLNVKKVITRYGDKVEEYIDYINAIREVDDYRKDEKAFMYPSMERLMPLHDEFMKKLEKKRKTDERRRQKERNAKMIKAKEAENKLIEEYAKMLEIFEYRADGFLIRPLKSVSDMVHESEVMHHCIKTYTDKYSKKICSLFTIRTEARPNVPICSVEIKYNNYGWFLVQSRGKCNTDPKDEVKAFIKKWMTHVADICKQRKNKKIVKQLHAA